jgi:CHAD domain-containing protein
MMSKQTVTEIALGVFQKQFNAIQLHLNGCIEGTDTIHLHDLRVANRRTRAAMSEFEDFLPEDVFSHYRKEFRWLHKITGEVRDFDVSLAQFKDYQKQIPKTWKPHLKSLRELLTNKRDEAQIILANNLESDRLKDLIKGWSLILDEGLLPSNSITQDSAKEYGCRMIMKRYRKVRKKGSKLTKKTPAKRFHAYRITVKRLRYLMEFFRPTIDDEMYHRLRTGLKAVQDAFGAYQDADVHRKNMLNLAEESHQAGVPLETILALGQMLGLIEKQARRSKKKSLKQVRWLVSDATARSFQSCFQYPVK